LKELATFLEQSRAAYLADLAVLVGRDCGTYNKAGVDAVGTWIAERCAQWQWEVERFPLERYGDCWLARLRGAGAGRLMLSGHLDTVYPDGTVAARPLRAEGARLIGPGTCDMKAGVLAGMYALRALQFVGWRDFQEIVFFFNSDEEVGSPLSRALYAPLARQMDAALVLEAARANGDIVGARKGAGLYRIAVKGKAAHAGVEPEKGANAILELAYQIIAVQRLNGIRPGVTVNVGVVRGGMRTNVVPDEAWVDIDVRALDPEGADALSRAILNLSQQISVDGTRVEITGSFGCPPMPKTQSIAALAACAAQIAEEMGFTLKDTHTGGVSDANVIASLGVPVLDGLGPVGGLDHGPDEYIEPATIVPRITLLAELMRRTLEMRERLGALKG
jgi:glutamate carboxypeptidase